MPSLRSWTRLRPCRSGVRRRLLAAPYQLSSLLLTTCAAATLLTAASPARAQGVEVTHTERRYDQRAYLGTHNSYANPHEGFQPAHFSISTNQEVSTLSQLDSGVRWLNPDIWIVKQAPFIDPFLNQTRYAGLVIKGNDTKRIGDIVVGVNWDTVPTEIVVAHNPWDAGYSGMADTNATRFKSLRQWLSEVVSWLAQHDAVVALDLENWVWAEHKPLLEQTWRDSGAEYYTFYPNRPNLRMPAPNGRGGGWDVRKYGWPSEALMRQYDYKLVFFDYYSFTPEGSTLGDPTTGLVRTNYGDSSLNPDSWTNDRGDGNSILDFRRGMFLMDHIPSLPQWPQNDIIQYLNPRLEDLLARWDRLPNFLEVDYFQRGRSTTQPRDGGPKEFVDNLDALWAQVAGTNPIKAKIQTSALPNAKGWYNRPLDITMATEAPATARYFLYTEFDENGAFPKPVSQVSATENSPFRYEEDGVSTFSFAAVGANGNKSNHLLVDIKLDKTAPTATLTAQVLSNLPPPPNQFFLHMEGRIGDTLSKLDWSTAKLVITDEYGEDNETYNLTPTPLPVPLDEEAYGVAFAVSNQVRANDMDGRRTYSVRLEVSDNAGNTTVKTSTVVAPITNRAPIARAGSDQVIAVPHDGNPASSLAAFTLNGLASSDPDNDTPLRFQWKDSSGNVVSNAATLTSSRPAGTYLYTLTVTDPLAASASDSVQITVLPEPNRGPTAPVRSVSVAEDTTLGITLVANDPEGDPLSFQITSLPQHGTLVGAQTNFTYTPDANYSGSDSFTYFVTDTYGSRITGTINIQVTPVNDQPQAEDDSAVTTKNTAVTLSVLENDLDVDGDTLSVTAVGTPSAGSVTRNSDGTITFQPKNGFKGTVSFSYTASDGKGGTDTATVTVEVEGKNKPPRARHDRAGTRQNTPVTIAVLGNDRDPDGDRLTVMNASQGRRGSTRVNPDGTITYTPNTGFRGLDLFRYQIGDGKGKTDCAWVLVLVR